MRSILLATCVLALCSTNVQAQKPALERVDSLVAAGETTRAAALLQQWRQANTSDNNPHALYLAAQLESNAEAARDLYVTIALSHPTSNYAAPALLRLGQVSHAAGDWQRAISYLDRLLTDYPAARERESGYLWLMRANMAGGRNTEACAIAGRALRGEVRDADVSEQVRSDERRACATPNSAPSASTAPQNSQPRPAAPVAAPSTSSRAAPADSTTVAPTSSSKAAQPNTGRPAPPPPGRADAPRTTSDNTRSSARFAVQAGAFKDARGANSIASGLKKAGFDARVTQLEGTTLNHVRVGHFATRADAAAMVQRLKVKGFNALIVDDVAREK